MELSNCQTGSSGKDDTLNASILEKVLNDFERLYLLIMYNNHSCISFELQCSGSDASHNEVGTVLIWRFSEYVTTRVVCLCL